MVCLRCGTANPDEARFCLSCGTPLEQRTPEAVRVGRAMQGERRTVTMLFCDVKGSTAMAEGLDPEDWAEIMNGAFEHLIAPVYRYEGTLARLMGDAVFALFGAPVAHEDDPQRAVSAGLEIIEGIQPYRAKVETERGLDLNVRVGINTGPVMVGEVGSELRVEYTAMGDAVNVAARMEQTAEPGTVQITEDTHRWVAPLFDVESRGAIEVKGKADPCPPSRCCGRKARPGPVRGSRIGGRESPLVGREREMAIIRRAVAETFAGRGRIVSLVGDAGLGKSRLIEETQRDWALHQPDDARSSQDARRVWEVWRCVSYDTTRPYAQYRRILATIAGIRDTDPPGVVREKLAGTIDLPEEWVEPHMRVWRPLFGVQEPEEEPLEGEAFRHAITELVIGSTRQAGSDPRLLVFDDMHWCDEASMDLLIETLKVVEDLPCLILIAFRPERHAASWRLKQVLEAEYPHRSSEVVLSPLSDAESDALIDELLPEEVRTNPLRAQILERTDGNPLFVEEVAAAVLEQEQEEQDEIAIPSTLQALFTARLDRLDGETRRAIQLASVIGRSFAGPVLQAIAGDGFDTRSQLGTLERVGLIDEIARVPELEYAFHHSLTQEAIYGTILLRRRRELHLRVGEVLEERYASRLAEYAPLLVHHFREAGDDHRTVKYATLAGESAARLDANADAVTHYTSAIEAARRLEETGERLSNLYLARGRALRLLGRFDDARENDDQMQSVAQTSGSADA